MDAKPYTKHADLYEEDAEPYEKNEELNEEVQKESRSME